MNLTFYGLKYKEIAENFHHAMTPHRNQYGAVEISGYDLATVYRKSMNAEYPRFVENIF